MGTPLWGDHPSPPLGVRGLPMPGDQRLYPGGWQQAVPWVPGAPVPPSPAPRPPSSSRGCLQRRYVCLESVLQLCLKAFGEKKIEGAQRPPWVPQWVPAVCRSTAGGRPVRVSPPEPWHAPQAPGACMPSSARTRTRFMAGMADGEGQCWPFTRQLEDGSCFHCQHQYDPTANPVPPGWLQVLTGYFPLGSTVSAVRRDKKPEVSRLHGFVY